MRVGKLLGKVKKNLFRMAFKFAGYERKEMLLRKICYHVGTNTRICNNDFGTEPYMISIGNDVIVAAGVKFIEHDASYFNMCRYNGVSAYEYEKIGPIVLRNNCFIGGYSVLLQGTDVGENSVIAAGSVVNKKIPANEVWGGVPAHFIMSVSDYAKKVDERNKKLPWYGQHDKYSDEERIRMRQAFFFEE